MLIVYLILGFRNYSNYFSSIQPAPNTGDETTARMLLVEWSELNATDMDVSDIYPIVVEKALITTYRHVFDVFYWFLMPVGPTCSVMYLVVEYLACSWNELDHMKNEAF